MPVDPFATTATAQADDGPPPAHYAATVQALTGHAPLVLVPEIDGGRTARTAFGLDPRALDGDPVRVAYGPNDELLVTAAEYSFPGAPHA